MVKSENQINLPNWKKNQAKSTDNKIYYGLLCHKHNNNINCWILINIYFNYANDFYL